MKVLQINAVNGIRSTGKITLETSEFLFLNGIDNYIAYSYGLESRNSFKIGNKFDRLIHSFFSRLFGLQGYFSFISTHMLLSYIKKIKPDIIHIRNLHSNYINIKLLFNYIIRN